MNAIWVDLVTKVLHLLYHEQTLWLLQLCISCLQSFQNCHQVQQMFLLSLSCDQNVVHVRSYVRDSFDQAINCSLKKGLEKQHYKWQSVVLEKTSMNVGNFSPVEVAGMHVGGLTLKKTVPPASVAKGLSTLGRGYESSREAWFIVIQ